MKVLVALSLTLLAISAQAAPTGVDSALAKRKDADTDIFYRYPAWVYDKEDASAREKRKGADTTNIFHNYLADWIYDKGDATASTPDAKEKRETADTDIFYSYPAGWDYDKEAITAKRTDAQ